MHPLIAPAVNLGLLLGFLFWKLREPAKSFVRTRHATVRDEVEKSARDLKSARAKFDEFAARISTFSSEAAMLHQQAVADAQAMKSRLITESKRLSAVIVVDATSAASAMFSDFKGQLRSELANRVLDRAEAALQSRLTSDDRIRIRREFSTQVGSA